MCVVDRPGCIDAGGAGISDTQWLDHSHCRLAARALL